MASVITDIPTQIDTRPEYTNGINLDKPPQTEQIIRRYLPDVADTQVSRYAKLLERLLAVNQFLETFPEDKGPYEHLLTRAEKALDYKQPYRIAIIGTTGVGKSTLINALLGRKLVLVKDVGKPATGAALEIFLDVDADEEEYALVTYRSEDNIQDLVAEFMARYEVNAQALPENLNQAYLHQLRNLEPSQQLGDQTQQAFEGLRDSLADIVEQFLSVNQNALLSDYKLNNPRHVEDLMNLTDENSPLNSGPGRCIGLVRSVAYHIQPMQHDDLKTLDLPHNVCLVDLPGLDGSPLHDIIISEGIKEADAVIFILRPPRILNRGDAYLLNRVRKYISLDGAVDSAERIFLILNAVDDITRDEVSTLNNLPRDMRELMDLIAPGYATRFATRGGEQPYFMTSAWTAFNAQNALQGRSLEDQRTYQSKAVKYNLDAHDHNTMLAASQVPRLAEALNEFARSYRIEGQLREGRQALDRITTGLKEAYTSELKLLTNGQGISYIKSEDGRLIKERQENLADVIVDFRLRQLDNLENLRNELRNEAIRLCDRIDTRLREDLPRLWKRFFVADRYRPRARRYGKTRFEVFLGEVELLLWRQLAIRVQSLAALITSSYQAAFEASHIPHTLVIYGYDHPLASAAATGLENITADMKASLSKLSERLALIYMLEPKVGFIPPEQLNDGGQLAQNALIQALDDLPRQRELELEAFDAFIIAVRAHYQPAVVDYSVNALLNIFQYEMIYIEDTLMSRVEELFNELRETMPHDALLCGKIRQEAPDEERDRIEWLDQKRKALAEAVAETA